MSGFRTSIPKNNFSSGQVDRDVKGRFDLPLFQNGHEISRNFFHTIKGDCYYRTGFEYLDEIGRAALYEFKFNQTQSYLLVFRTQYIEFWSYNSNNELVRVLDDKKQELKFPIPNPNPIFLLFLISVVIPFQLSSFTYLFFISSFSFSTIEFFHIFMV